MRFSPKRHILPFSNGPSVGSMSYCRRPSRLFPKAPGTRSCASRRNGRCSRSCRVARRRTAGAALQPISSKEDGMTSEQDRSEGSDQQGQPEAQAQEGQSEDQGQSGAEAGGARQDQGAQDEAGSQQDQSQD